MAEILLIRHGQSANNAGPETERVCDPNLTALGKQQAQVAADFLAKRSITHLYCSPFLRALETTAPIAKKTNLIPSVRPDIFEVGGCYSGHDAVGRKGEPGLGAQDIAKAYLGWSIDDSISASGWWGQPFESMDQAVARAQSVAQWLRREIAIIPGAHALVIHADFKHLLLTELLGQEPELGEPLYNVGITTFKVQDENWHPVRLNSVEHFSSELISH